ncbi:MAG: ferrous iron transport protein A [Pirellula sp.]|jgi:Fe2+ transport system protein FeoA|nr:ferrous iron transport protein A [Planctomycetota bacterium]
MSPPWNLNAVPVEYLAPETEGVVVDLCGEEKNVHRLEELGIRCGCKIRMLCPGETCLLAIEGKKMCLRLNSTAEILVQPLTP